MDSTPPSPESVSAKPKRLPRPAFRNTLALGVLFLIAILLLVYILSPGSKVVWLLPSEVNRSAHSTWLSRFKYRAAQLAWPVIHNFWHARPFIMTKATFMTLSESAKEQTGLDAPFATNTDGIRIWILSPKELAAFQKQLTNSPGVETQNRTTMHGLDGTPTAISVGGPPVAATGPVVWHPTGGSSNANSLFVMLTPKINSDSINLTLAITSTTTLSVSQPGNPGVTRTNVSAACRVLVPNSGALIMDGGNARDDSGKTYWLIASPTAVDSKGNPVKL